MKVIKSRVLIVLFGLWVANLASAAEVVYNAPSQDYIAGINNLFVIGTANDGIYNITFSEGSFDAVFGAATMTADLPFQSESHADVVAALISDVLNNASPNDRVGSTTEAAAGSGGIFIDLYQIPYVAAPTTYNAQLNALETSSGLWDPGGTIGSIDRTTTLAPGVCSTCIAKWASFTFVGQIPPTDPVPSVSPFGITIMILVLVTAALIYLRRRSFSVN